MSKHTPGPWRTQDAFLNVYQLSDGDTGISTHIAKISDHQVDGGHKEALSNMRLIAAAPELLEALRLMVAIHDEPSGFSGKWGKALDEAINEQQQKIDARLMKARAAISKATGQEEA